MNRQQLFSSTLATGLATLLPLKSMALPVTKTLSTQKNPFDEKWLVSSYELNDKIRPFTLAVNVNCDGSCMGGTPGTSHVGTHHNIKWYIGSELAYYGLYEPFNKTH